MRFLFRRWVDRLRRRSNPALKPGAGIRRTPNPPLPIGRFEGFAAVSADARAQLEADRLDFELEDVRRDAPEQVRSLND